MLTNIPAFVSQVQDNPDFAQQREGAAAVCANLLDSIDNSLNVNRDN